MKTLRPIPRSVLFAGALFVASLASAQVTLTTNPPWDGASSVGTFGQPATATYGQTFLAPIAAPVLQDFSFWVLNLSGATTFRGYVMAWDGAKASGSALFASGDYTVTQSGYEKVTFSTGNLALNGGSQYVAFFSASEVFDDTDDEAVFGFVSTNPYADGLFVFQNNGANFSALTSTNWQGNWWGDSSDLAFEMNFAQAGRLPPTSAVPEPATYGMFAAAALAGLAIRRRRRTVAN